MQTFLPYASFSESAKVLDYRRLGKQRVECKQIFNALEGLTKGWVNHPATRMWRGHEYALALYGKVICREWISRGYNDQQLPFFEEKESYYMCQVHWADRVNPFWLGDQAFHDSHKSNLLRKNKEFYSQYNWDVPDNLEYIWPI